MFTLHAVYVLCDNDKSDHESYTLKSVVNGEGEGGSMSTEVPGHFYSACFFFYVQANDQDQFVGASAFLYITIDHIC